MSKIGSFIDINQEEEEIEIQKTLIIATNNQLLCNMTQGIDGVNTCESALDEVKSLLNKYSLNDVQKNFSFILNKQDKDYERSINILKELDIKFFSVIFENNKSAVKDIIKSV